MHAIGHGADGQPCLVDHPDDTSVQFCVDRRGAWLQLRESAHGLHVNGRPVRRMAMLRAGDAVHMDGIELTLLGARPAPLPAGSSAAPEALRHVVLRGIGGVHHGRCFSLDTPCVVGRSAVSDIQIADPALGDRHARLEPHDDGILLHDLDSPGGSLVNGHPVRNGVLLPGDQIVFGANHRFVLEAPTSSEKAAEPVWTPAESFDTATDRAPSRSPVALSIRRIPWLLLAALLLAGGLALLLLYGVR